MTPQELSDRLWHARTRNQAGPAPRPPMTDGRFSMTNFQSRRSKP